MRAITLLTTAMCVREVEVSCRQTHQKLYFQAFRGQASRTVAGPVGACVVPERRRELFLKLTNVSCDVVQTMR